jgi:hypothetical protein
VDIFDPALRADPYSGFRKLRETAPIYRTPGGLFVLTRFADCATVLDDHRWGHGYAEGLNPLRPGVNPDDVFGAFLRMDPPDHTRLRRLVSKAFTPKVIATLRQRIAELSGSMVGDLIASGGGDVVAALAYPLPLTIICEMLGVPPEDEDLFRDWSSALARGTDPDELLTQQEIAARAAALTGFAEYFRGHVASRRANPTDDLVSQLAAVEENGDVLTEREMLDTCVLLLAAGHETTANLISNGVLALARNPDQADLLRAQPDLMPAAVEEILRYDAPVQIALRVALRDCQLDGREFHRSEAVMLLLGAANRDPAAFADPERFDVARFTEGAGAGASAKRHLAFGFGIHFCLGAYLARLEAEMVLGALLGRTTAVTLAADPPPYRPHLGLRGVASLPVQLTAA